MQCHVSVLAASLPPWVTDYAAWWIAALIVFGGLLLFGWDELWHLRWRRIWAISSVSFAESLRRKVLWVTPLAIIGVIVVSALQHTSDPQDTIRQTIKFCLFASGLLVTITAVILACTNLPREIENRVIYTIVTKPTSRLEIVLGKVVGFIRVSGLIVLIMGAFTFVFLGMQSRTLGAQIAERLKTEVDPATRQTLEGYRAAGLLSTKSLVTPVQFDVYQHGPNDGGPQWLNGYYGYSFLVPFQPDDQQKELLNAAVADPTKAQVLVINTMRLKRNPPTKEDEQWIQSRKLPTEPSLMGPSLPGHETYPLPIPQISIRILDQDLNEVVSAKQINNGELISVPLDRQNQDGSYTIVVGLSPSAVATIAGLKKFWISVIPETNSVEYEVRQMPTVLDVLTADRTEHMIRPAPDPRGPNGLASPRFISQSNRWGMKIMGSAKGDGSVGVFRFAGAQVPKDLSGNVVFRFRAGIERGGDYDASSEWSTVTLTVLNRKTGQKSDPIDFHPETSHDSPVLVPGKYVEGGDFDVWVRGMNNGQFIGLADDSVQLISAEHSFVINLLESLLILWLMSILVVVIAIFTSTFLSWPIAVVLTLLLLLGHWGVTELGDALSPGVGRSVASDLGFRDAAQTKVVSASVDALAKVLNTVSSVLPDLSKFPVMDDITRGVSIPGSSIAGSLSVLACYGLPMLVLSFLILKNKEVAP